MQALLQWVFLEITMCTLRVYSDKMKLLCDGDNPSGSGVSTSFILWKMVAAEPFHDFDSDTNKFIR